MNKECRRCLQSKEITQFAKDKSKKDGYQRLCKKCDSKKGREYYNANKEKKLKYSRLRYANNRYARVKEKYNLSDYDYDTMIINQDGVCKICQKKDIMDLSVDHDHSCCPGRKSCGLCIRGLLCKRCNMALGAFNDDIDSMLKAIDYLLDWQKKDE